MFIETRHKANVKMRNGFFPEKKIGIIFDECVKYPVRHENHFLTFADEQIDQFV